MKSSSSLKLCWLAQGTESYGLAQAILTLARAAAQAGAEVRILAMADGPLAEAAAEAGLNTDVLGLGRAPTLGGPLPGRFSKLNASRRYQRHAVKRVLGQLEPDLPAVIHCTSPALVGLTAVTASATKALGVWEMPNVIGDGSRLPLGRWYFQYLAARYDMLILANSRYTASSFGRWPRRARTFHLGIDESRFDPSRVRAYARQDLGLPADAQVFTVAARLDASKGQLPLWEALLSLEVDGAHCHLLVLGGPENGPTADALKQRARDAGAEHRLHLHGSVNDPERYYGVTDIAVNSRINPEPFGLSVIEAMLMGRPVLAHAAGGPGETVLDGQTGWLTHDPSVEGWKRALRRVLAESGDWPRLGQQAREHALTHYTSQHQARRYFEALASRGVFFQPHDSV